MKISLVALVSALILGCAGEGDVKNASTVDSHFHLVSPENWQQSPIGVMGVIDGPLDAALASQQLDAAGVDMAVLLSGAYFFKEQALAEYENNFAAAQVRTNPDRFIGLCSVSAPQEWALAEFERCVKELGLSGLKLHLMADQMSLSNPEHLAIVDGLFKKAAELRPGFPVLIDFNWIDDTQIMTMIQLVMANPDTTVVLAHGLGHHYEELVAVKIMEDALRQSLNNLYMDLSATSVLYPPDSPPFASYIWHLREFGFHRILFGSDFPASTPQASVESIRNFGLSDEELRQVLGGNALKVFGNEEQGVMADRL